MENRNQVNCTCSIAGMNYIVKAPVASLHRAPSASFLTSQNSIDNRKKKEKISLSKSFSRSNSFTQKQTSFHNETSSKNFESTVQISEKFAKRQPNLMKTLVKKAKKPNSSSTFINSYHHIQSGLASITKTPTKSHLITKELGQCKKQVPVANQQPIKMTEIEKINSVLALCGQNKQKNTYSRENAYYLSLNNSLSNMSKFQQIKNRPIVKIQDLGCRDQFSSKISSYCESSMQAKRSTAKFTAETGSNFTTPKNQRFLKQQSWMHRPQ